MAAFLSKAQDLPSLLVNLIIRPPRACYEEDHLGPKKFTINKRVVERFDVVLTNERGLSLQCSHFIQTPIMPAPCVVYMHGNCGCRLDSFESVMMLLRDGISLFCFDFSGSGLSDGRYISLGFYEREDVKTVVGHLRMMDHVTTIGLWGRSMGAATAIMYASTDPSIAGIVLDSPFTSLPVLASEIVNSSDIPFQIPNVAFKVGMKAIRKSVKKKAKFDIKTIVPIEYIGQCFAPSFFIHGKQDNFILPQHSQALYDAYPGDKNILLVEGDHNTKRPPFCLDSISIFFLNTLLSGESIETPAGAIPPELALIPSLEDLELEKDLPTIKTMDQELKVALANSLGDIRDPELFLFGLDSSGEESTPVPEKRKKQSQPSLSGLFHSSESTCTNRIDHIHVASDPGMKRKRKRKQRGKLGRSGSETASSSSKKKSSSSSKGKSTTSIKRVKSKSKKEKSSKKEKEKISRPKPAEHRLSPPHSRSMNSGIPSDNTKGMPKEEMSSNCSKKEEKEEKKKG